MNLSKIKKKIIYKYSLRSIFKPGARSTDRGEASNQIKKGRKRGRQWRISEIGEGIRDNSLGGGQRLDSIG